MPGLDLLRSHIHPVATIGPQSIRPVTESISDDGSRSADVAGLASRPAAEIWPDTAAGPHRSSRTGTKPRRITTPMSASCARRSNPISRRSRDRSHRGRASVSTWSRPSRSDRASRASSRRVAADSPRLAARSSPSIAVGVIALVVVHRALVAVHEERARQVTRRARRSRTAGAGRAGAPATPAQSVSAMLDWARQQLPPAAVLLSRPGHSNQPRRRRVQQRSDTGSGVRPDVWLCRRYPGVADRGGDQPGPRPRSRRGRPGGDVRVGSATRSPCARRSPTRPPSSRPGRRPTPPRAAWPNSNCCTTRPFRRAEPQQRLWRTGSSICARRRCSCTWRTRRP